MKKDRLHKLLIKYIADTISDAELHELLDYVGDEAEQPEMQGLLGAILEETDADSHIDVNSQELYQRIVNHRGFAKSKKVVGLRRWWSYSAAAVLLLAVGLGLTQLLSNRGDDSGQPRDAITRTVTTAPSARPLLFLADGRTLDLDSLSDGLLAVEDGIQITMLNDALHYEGDITTIEATVPTNTIVIPKGRQYQIALPDGSKVWLNAASKVTYPIRFGKDRREVEVVGEAYFEVKHAEDWPFVVNTALQQIKVLGTSFNVHAYPDDTQAKTTLVDGRVNVSSVSDLTNGQSPESLVLRPGEQVRSQVGHPGLTVNSVDPEDVVSWKDNLFVFSNEEISEVMKKVSRWYDVEIEYRDGMAGKRIGGSIPRLADVGELMDALEATGLLHYEMKGGVVIIRK